MNPGYARKGLVRQAMLEKITRHTVGIDITYRCNARCRYCRWGDGRTGERGHLGMDDVLVRAETLRDLGARRVVLSGGEPRLHPEIGRILGHYAGLVDDVIVITNGYGLGPREVRRLLGAGATGVTVSLDSVDAGASARARLTPPGTHAKILDSIREIASEVHGFEFGINATVSHATSDWASAGGLLGFAGDVGMDFVKFQPLFDDGYASGSAPDLLLTGEDAAGLEDVADRLGEAHEGFPLTNPPGFWRDVAAMCSGRPPAGSACGLGARQALSTGGRLAMCYWVEGSTYGRVSDGIGSGDILRVQGGFGGLKRRCEVDFHCFCTQRIDHVWS